MPELKQYQTRLTLGSLFSGTFTLIKETWKGSLVMNLVIFVVPSLFLGLTMGEYMGLLSLLMDLTGAESDPDPYLLLVKSIPALVFFLLSGLTLNPALVLSTGATALYGHRILTGETGGWAAALKTGLRHFGRLFLYVLFRDFLMVVLLIAGMALCIVPAVFLMIAEIQGPAVALIVLGYFTTLLLAVIYRIIQQTAPLSLLMDNKGPFSGFAAPFRLLKGSFFRFSGTALLAEFICYTVVSTALSPLMIIMMIPFYTVFFMAISQGLSDTESLATIFKSLRVMGYCLGPVYLASFTLTAMIRPLIDLQQWLDLKVRKGELPDLAAVSGDGSSVPVRQ